MLKLKSQLTRIIFFSEKNNFCIGIFKELTSKKSFTAKGTLVEPMIGGRYELEGSTVVDPKYGKQFQFSRYELLLEEDPQAMIRFLKKKRFDLLRPEDPKRIYEALGDDLIKKIYERPELVRELDFLDEARQDQLIDGVRHYLDRDTLTLQLIRSGLSQKEIDLLLTNYPNLRSVLQRDCFEPYYRLYGFGYFSAVKLADGYHYPPGDPRRCAAILFENLRSNLYQSGSTWLSVRQLQEKTPTLNKERFQQALELLEQKNMVMVDNNQVYLRRMYQQEWTIANLLKEHSHIPIVRLEDLDHQIQRLEEYFNIQYDPRQKQAISSFFQHPLMLINGGPGTGKSTIVKAVLHLIRDQFPASQIGLCAPTGRAAKRLEEITQIEARTIHSMLQWNIDTNSFARNASNPLDLDFVIVDECSMIDTHIFSSLLAALPERCRILLIGDEYQLESVGPGRVFNDLVESGKIRLCSLETVFRTKEGSEIASLAHQIKQGEEPEFGRDTIFLDMKDEQMAEEVRRLAQEFRSDEEFQVLAPMYEGKAGILALNKVLQEQFNPFDPSKPQIAYKSMIFRQGDKILLKKNMSEKGVFNGDIGYIKEIDLHTKTVTVDFDGLEVDFSEEIPSYLSHAWAISIHKSQGSEYQNVICIFPREARHMLARRLIYTAVSRAKKTLKVLSQPATFQKGVSMQERNTRQCSLKDKLLSLSFSN